MNRDQDLRRRCTIDVVGSRSRCELENKYGSLPLLTNKKRRGNSRQLSVLEKALPKFARRHLSADKLAHQPRPRRSFRAICFLLRRYSSRLELSLSGHHNPLTMYRAALRSSPSSLRAVRPTVSSGSRRLLSTATRTKGTWKGTGFRWGLAAAAVYFYNTSPIFADEVPRRYPSHERRWTTN